MSCEYNHNYPIRCYQEIPSCISHNKANFCPDCGEPLIEPEALIQEEAEVMLLVKANEENAYIVASHMSRARYLHKKANDLGLNIHSPLTYEEFIKKQYYGRGIKKFILENVLHFMYYVSPDVEIEIYTHKPKE